MTSALPEWGVASIEAIAPASDTLTTPDTGRSTSSTHHVVDVGFSGHQALFLDNAGVDHFALWSWLPDPIDEMIDVPGGGKLDIGMASTNFNFFLDASISPGALDVSYPVQLAIDTPENVRPGDSFDIATALLSVNRPSLELDGPSDWGRR